MVKDIYPGSSSGDPNYIIAAGSTLYFSANNGTNGYELWKSDGTSGNTVQLADIAVLPATSASSYPSYLTYADGIVYFQAQNTTYGAELWKSVSGGSPTLVKDIYPGSSSSSPYKITPLVVGTTNDIAFRANTATNGSDLFRSDGTNGGTVAVDINYTSTLVFGPPIHFEYDYTGSSSPDYLTVAGSYIYMAATNSSGEREIYRFDGSTATLVDSGIA